MARISGVRDPAATAQSGRAETKLKTPTDFALLTVGSLLPLEANLCFARKGVLMLATLAQHWKLRQVTEHPAELRSLITLRPRFGMKMRLEKRSFIKRQCHCYQS